MFPPKFEPKTSRLEAQSFTTKLVSSVKKSMKFLFIRKEKTIIKNARSQQHQGENTLIINYLLIQSVAIQNVHSHLFKIFARKYLSATGAEVTEALDRTIAQAVIC